MKARRQCDDIFKVLEKKILIHHNYPSKNEEEIKMFSNKQKPRQSLINRPALHKMLKDVFKVNIEAH